MRRPGVQYWTPTRSVHSHPRSFTPPGSPLVSHSSAADCNILREDAIPSLRSISSPPLVQTSVSPPPPSSTPGCCSLECEDASRNMPSAHPQAKLPQRKKEVTALEAPFTRERVDNATSLNAAQASLQREQSLRVTAEQERRVVQAECKQLRNVLRALLAQSPGNNSAGSSSLTVPVCLYESARHLLLRCEKAFAELRALQLRATDPACLELLRRYDIPVLDDIPPAWPPGTPPRGGKGKRLHEPAAVRVVGNSHTTPFASKRVVAGVTQAPREGRHTGVDTSAPTIVSANTPCGPSAATRENCEVTAPLDASRGQPGEGHILPVDTSSNGKGEVDRRGEIISADTRRRPRPVILSPPPPSQDFTTTETAPPWTGPMHKFPGISTALDALPLEPHHIRDDMQSGEMGQEDRARDADRLLRRMAEEVATLAASQGLRTPSEVAALCRLRGLPYIDAVFLPVLETLALDDVSQYGGYDPERASPLVVQWRPRSAILPPGRRAELSTSACIDPNMLDCGPLGDFGVAAAFAALAEATGAVTSVLASTTAEDEDNGLYSVWLCVRGWWMCVTVDSFLPCVVKQDGSVALYGCRSTPVYDLWPSICEKALAKVLRGYRSLSSLTAETVVGHFTGGPVEYWDWWHKSSVAALEEMEAVLNTNARGAGVVLLSTFPESALDDTSPKPIGKSKAHSAYLRLGLRPGTSYRVLAVADNEEGEPIVLVRNWTRQHMQRLGGPIGSSFGRDPGVAGGTGRDTPPRGETNNWVAAAEGRSARRSSQFTVAADHGGSCIWLNYAKEVLPYFDSCHVCFDCRRYHDLRVPIVFFGHRPGIPAQLVRVRVQESPARVDPAGRRCPARLWIGLHQPRTSVSTSDAASTDFPWGLKLTLVGQEEAPAPFGVEDGGMRSARRSYLLSESFLGEPQVLPAVWMYLELESVAEGVPHLFGEVKDEGTAAARTTAEFFVVPQIERIVEMDRVCGDGDDHTVVSLGCGALGTATTSVVAVLTENRDSVLVDVVDAPEELRAAMYHDVLDRIDLSDCQLARGSGQRPTSGLPRSDTAAEPGEVRCQLNGRDMRMFSW